MDLFDTRLTVAVPTRHEESLRAALQGDNGWPYAVAYDPEQDPLEGVSAHARVAAQHAVEHNASDLQAQLRAAHPHHPAWMPLCKAYALAWAHNPYDSIQHLTTVGLSFPKLLPLSQDDWTACFPGTTDLLGWWTPAAGTAPYLEQSPHGWFAATRRAIGTAPFPWGQEQETLGTTEHNGVETTVLCFQWRALTPTIIGLSTALQPILARHQASALLVGVGGPKEYTEQISVMYWLQNGGRPTAYDTERNTNEPEATALQRIWPYLEHDPLHHFQHSLFPS